MKSDEEERMRKGNFHSLFFIFKDKNYVRD